MQQLIIHIIPQINIILVIGEELKTKNIQSGKYIIQGGPTTPVEIQNFTLVSPSSPHLYFVSYNLFTQ